MAWPSLNLGNFDKIQRINRGVICKMTTLQFIKGPNAKMHLTMLISGSKYPKNIYGMSLFELGLKKNSNLNSNSNLNENRKGKTKRKRKRKKNSGTATWAGFGRAGPIF